MESLYHFSVQIRDHRSPAKCFCPFQQTSNFSRLMMTTVILDPWNKPLCHCKLTIVQEHQDLEESKENYLMEQIRMQRMRRPSQLGRDISYVLQ